MVNHDHINKKTRIEDAQQIQRNAEWIQLGNILICLQIYLLKENVTFLEPNGHTLIQNLATYRQISAYFQES